MPRFEPDASGGTGEGSDLVHWAGMAGHGYGKGAAPLAGGGRDLAVGKPIGTVFRGRVLFAPVGGLSDRTSRHGGRFPWRGHAVIESRPLPPGLVVVSLRWRMPRFEPDASWVTGEG